MAQIYNSLSELVGNTPLLRLNNFMQLHGVKAEILAKLESFNPAGSAKDRIAVAMIDKAERDGILQKGSVIIEPTSGNTGIGLACAAAARGYKLILTMPDTMSIERRTLLAAYGAQLVLTPGELGMNGSIEKARELAASIEGSFIPSQFDNPENPAAHYAGTGPEIWRDCGGRLDIFVSGIGSGGTITGTGRYLKEQCSKIKVIAVEPADSPLLSAGRAGTHAIQGIGANFVPSVLDCSVYDEIICADTENSYNTVRELVSTEGLLVGVSSGAALWAALTAARRIENEGKRIVVLLPDSGERYLSTPGLFS